MPGALVGALRVTLGIDTAAFEEGLGIAQKRLNAAGKKMAAVGDQMAAVGSNLSVAVTAPLLAAGAAAIKGAQDQAQAMAQVNAALESMGPVAGRTAEQLLKASDALELRSLYDGDEILSKVTANMLTFGNVTGDTFDRAQQAVIDLSTRMGTDLQAATIMVGKALNDPKNGLAALGKTGALTKEWVKENKGLIASLVDTGRTAEAQAMILAALEKQYRGSAEAAADTDPWRKAEVAFGQAGDKIGEALLPAITKVADFAARLATAFTNLSPETQSLVLGFAGVAAVVGPVLVVLGTLVSSISALMAVFAPLEALIGAGGLGAAFTALGAAIAPFLLPIAAVAAVGALIYANWDKIAPVIEEFGAKFSAALGPKLQSLIETVKTTLTELWNGPFGAAIRVVIGVLGEMQAAYLSVFGEVIIRIVSALISFLDAQFKIIGDIFNIVIKLLSGDFAGAWEAMKSLIGNVITGVINILNSLAPGAIKAVSDMVNGVRQWVVNRLSAIWDTVIERIEAVKRAFFLLYDAVVGNSYVPDMVDEIGQNMARLEKLMVDPAKAATTATKNAFRDLTGEVSGLLDTLFPVQAQIRSVLADLALLDKARTKGLVSGDTFDAARDKLLTEKFALQNELNPLPVLVAQQMQPFKIALIELEQVLIQLPQAASDAEIALTELGNRLGNDIMAGLADILSGRGGFKEVISDLFSRFLEDIIGSVLRGLETQAFGDGGLGGALGGLFGSIFGGAPGFALGGSFTVGGRPGRDANLVAFRATRGETVEISRSEADAASRGGVGIAMGGAPVVNITNNIDASGADPAAIARLNSKLDQMNNDLPGEILRTVQDASDRRMINLGAR